MLVETLWFFAVSVLMFVGIVTPIYLLVGTAFAVYVYFDDRRYGFRRSFRDYLSLAIVGPIALVSDWWYNLGR